MGRAMMHLAGWMFALLAVASFLSGLARGSMKIARGERGWFGDFFFGAWLALTLFGALALACLS